jgi:hypothetical protein
MGTKPKIVGHPQDAKFKHATSTKDKRNQTPKKKKASTDGPRIGERKRDALDKRSKAPLQLARKKQCFAPVSETCSKAS